MSIDQISSGRAGLWPKTGTHREKPVAGDAGGFAIPVPTGLSEDVKVETGTRNGLGGTGAAASSFADLLPDAGAAPPAPPARSPGADEIDRLRKERADYQARRDAEVRSRPQEPYPAIQIALPVNGAGYQPFVTADQQKLIDSITDRYIGKAGMEFLKMWDELEAHGVAPDQLVRTARHFINDRGEIVGRDEAARAAAGTHVIGTAWTASEF